MKYRKKPVVIEAVQFTRDNWEEIHDFTEGSALNFCVDRSIDGKCYCQIQTLEGIMAATEGDYIIKGVNGEFYPCKPDIFEKTYDVVEHDDKMNREFEGLEVNYLSDEFCIYPEYMGKPYFAIKYKENGNHFVGYGTYNPEVLSGYLRDYFMPLAMPKESKWIPCSDRLPENEGNYLVTCKGRYNRFVEIVQFRFERFMICQDLCEVIAWYDEPLPLSYKGK